jgi:hypothetical protein
MVIIFSNWFSFISNRSKTNISIDLLLYRKPLNAHRALLAQEVNIVLAKCISTSHTKDSWALSLKQHLKDGLEKEHIFQIVGMAPALDNYVIVPRTALFLDEKAKATPPQLDSEASEDASMEDAPNFASFEKSLW